MPRAGGYTLIELLVVIAIIVFTSAAILANTTKFGGEAQLQNLAYDMALTVRQAQVYGISVRNNTPNNFLTGYGAYFNASNNTSYRLFSDANKNGHYDSGEDVAPSPFTIGKGYTISQLCTYGATTKCDNTTLNLVFIRPEPDAFINPTCTSQLDGSEGCAPSAFNKACIVVTSPRGDTAGIVVFSNGQIHVGIGSTNNDPCT